ncbi:MAG: EcsC family protein [Lachnospiraceae bacterium]|nr:EcsC family protein [Lachnospiraceae bacterium]
MNTTIFANRKQIRKSPVDKELAAIARAEERLEKQAVQHHAAKWKEALEQKIPQKVYDNLQKMFCVAFELIFEKGTALIEKTYSNHDLEKDFQVHDFAVELKGSRKELRSLKAEVNRSNLVNMAVSTVEGISLGVLGIGLPDIVLFLSVILKGTYETAVQYGFSYETQEERLYILKLLETAMSKGERWTACNAAVDRWIASADWHNADGGAVGTTFEAVKVSEQTRRTADAFAVDMLLAKFIQGIPVAGILGGITNPVYYGRIMRYVQLKYHKRYLLQKKNQQVPG